jgi:hypothetical protein
MKYGRYIVPGLLVAALVFVLVAGTRLLEPAVDLALRLFLPAFLAVWWCIGRNSQDSQTVPARRRGAAIDARLLIKGVADARESLVARRPSPVSEQHYRKTLLILAHRAVANTGYFKHRERPPDAEHMSA